MKIGKLEVNSKGWFWKGTKLVNPFVLLWRLLFLPLYLVSLAIFLVIAFITWGGNTRQVKIIWRETNPF